MSRREVLVRVGLVATLFSGCRGTPTPNQPSAPLIERLEVAGCREVRRGPVCELESDARLVLWVRTPPEVSLSIEGTSTEWTTVDGGRRTSVQVTTASTAVVIVARGARLERRVLPLQRWTKPAPLIRADRLRSRTASAARALLDGLDPGDDLRYASEIATMKARIAFADGKYEEAVEWRRQSARLGDRAGLIAKPALDFATIAYISIVPRRNVALARSSLAATRRRLPETIGPEAAIADFYAGALARATGDTRNALRYLERAERRAARLDAAVGGAAAQVRADLYASLGHHDRVTQIYDELAARPSVHQAPCAWAELRGNRAWATALAREAKVEGIRPDPQSDAAAAMEAFTSTCAWPEHVANLFTTMALSAVQSSDAPSAQRYLRRARAQHVPPSVHVRLWMLDIEARAERLAGRPAAAAAAYHRLEALARRVGSAVASWRAAAGLASIYEEQGKLRRALRAYENAEARLEGGAVPFANDEQALLVDARDAVARHQAGLLVRLGRPEAALEVLDRHAARGLRGLQRSYRLARLDDTARAKWDRAAMRYTALRSTLDELDARSWGQARTKDATVGRARTETEEQIAGALVEGLAALGQPAGPPPPKAPPRAHELVLTLDRIAAGWFAFAKTEAGSRVSPLPRIDEPADLLAAFDDWLETHRRVRVVARGASGQIDVHTLPWRGRPLISSHVVTYGVDAPRQAPRLGAAGRSVVVVGDPMGNLPAARDEVDVVAARASPAQVLVGRDMTRSRLIDALRGASRLHWAGHGIRDTQLGFSAALLLADGATFDAADILALGSAPASVVLSGCETAPVAVREVGPARAFILAGASAVVATTRRVKDRDAAAITSALYERADEPLDEALRRVQRAALEAGSTVDWAAFRVFVP